MKTLIDTRKILKFRTSGPPLTYKNSYPETDHSHMVVIITWIGLMTDISGLDILIEIRINQMKATIILIYQKSALEK